MEQEPAKNTINRVLKTSQEIVIEGQMNLPEYCSEVSRILDCRESLSVEAVAVTSDRISVSGKARFTLIYLGEDGRLSAYETVCKYTKNLSGAVFEASDYCKIEQKAGTLNFKATAPRRIEIVSAVTLEAEVFRKVPVFAAEIPEDQAVQIHPFHTELFDPSVFSSVKISLTDKLELPVEKDRMGAFLHFTVKPQIGEVSAIKNKILLKGSAEVCYSCIDLDGTVYSGLKTTLSFSEVKDVYGIDETSTIYLCLAGAFADADFRSASFSDREAPLDLELEYRITAGKATEMTFPDDAFLPGGELSLEKKEICLSEKAENVNITEKFSYTAEGFDKDVSEILDLSYSELQYRITQGNGPVMLIASFRFHILLRLADGSLYCASRKVSVSAEIPGDDGERQYFLSLSLPENSAAVGTDGSLVLTGVLVAEGFSVSQISKRLISEMKIKTKSEAAIEKIVIYYAGEGESIWDIAKAADLPYKTAMEKNNLSEDILREPAVLLLS